MPIIKKLRKAINKIKKNERVSVIYHSDADGISSAAITAYSLDKLGKKIETYDYFRYGDFERAKSLVKKGKQNKIKHCVFVDLNLDAEPKDFDYLDFLKSILLIDHHKNSFLKRKKITIIKADDYSKIPPSQYPACKLSYDLFSKILDIKEIRWKVIIGIYGDMAEKRWKKFVDTVVKKDKVSKKKILEIKEIVDAVEAIAPRKMNILLKDLIKAQKPNDFDFKKYSKIRQKFVREMERVEKETKRNIEKYNDLWIIEMKTKYGGLKSHIINRLTKRYPKKLLIIVAKNNGDVKISGRCRAGYNVRDILKEAGKGLDIRTGGHIPAAGANMMRKKYKKYKKNLIELFED